MGYYGNQADQRRLQRVTGLDKDALLWDKIPHTKIVSLVKSYRSQVLVLHQGENNYGEFWFMDLKVLPTNAMFRKDPTLEAYVIQVYGLGEHFERESWLVDHWKINQVEKLSWYHNYAKDDPPTKSEALKTLRDEYLIAEGQRGWGFVALLPITYGKLFSIRTLETDQIDPNTVRYPALTRGHRVKGTPDSITVRFDGGHWADFPRADRGKTWNWVQPGKSSRAKAFSLIADLSDDDAATIELEDHPGLEDLF